MSPSEKKFDAAARGKRLHELIGDAARQVASEHAAEIERRILDGENDFTVLDPTGTTKTRYRVPSWRRHPLLRWRVARRRRAHRAEQRERCARDSDWCDGRRCTELGIDCPNAELGRSE